MINKVQVTSDSKSKNQGSFIQGSSRLTGVTRTNLVWNSPVIDRKIAMLISDTYCVTIKSIEKEIKHCNWLHTIHGKWHENNKQKWNEYQNKYVEEHPEMNKKAQLKYRQKNIDKYREERAEYRRNRYKFNPKIRLNECMSSLISYSLRNGKKGKHWETLVGYTLDDLMKHLEKQFDSKMSWTNYGSYWWLDHIIPISVFNFDSYNDLDFGQCWALENLQPLEKIENIKKSNKINGTFQPNLKL